MKTLEYKERENTLILYFQGEINSITSESIEKESNLIDENYESREVGDLGTHIVKSFIDLYSYTRINGKNILVVRKNL